MNSVPILLATGVVLVGCAAIKGVNPLDLVVRCFIWLLYRFAALSLTAARSADAAYLCLRREYRKSVQQVNAEREAFQKRSENELDNMERKPQPAPARGFSADVVSAA